MEVLPWFVSIGDENSNFFLGGVYEFPELEQGEVNKCSAPGVHVLCTLEEDEEPLIAKGVRASESEEGERRRCSGNGERTTKSSVPTRNGQH